MAMRRPQGMELFESYRSSILAQEEALHTLLYQRGNNVAVNEYKLLNAKTKVIQDILQSYKDSSLAPELIGTYDHVFQGFQRLADVHREYVLVSLMFRYKQSSKSTSSAWIALFRRRLSERNLTPSSPNTTLSDPAGRRRSMNGWPRRR